MRAYPITQFGVDHLKQADLPMLQIARGMALIRIHAVSLNYRDLMMVKGLYNPKMALPRIPCSDGAGEIVAIGEGVSRVQVGDRVCGIFMQRWLDGPLTAERSKAALGGDIDGMLAEYALLDADGVVRFPEHPASWLAGSVVEREYTLLSASGPQALHVKRSCTWSRSRSL